MIGTYLMITEPQFLSVLHENILLGLISILLLLQGDAIFIEKYFLSKIRYLCFFNNNCTSSVPQLYLNLKCYHICMP